MASVDAHLREIRELADDRLGEHAARAPDDGDEPYRAALEAMRELGGEPAADQLAAELKRSIRKSETLPQDQSVRSLGRDILDEEGVEIPVDSWFAR